MIIWLVPREPEPCHPSPCGPNTVCENIGGQAVCRCLPNLQGQATSLSGCRAECTISSDCPGDRACINNRCSDPCGQNICGNRALCKTINHSPLCACPPNMIGNPFTECYEKQGIISFIRFFFQNLFWFCERLFSFLFFIFLETDLCNPNPCTSNGDCLIKNGLAICVYPECIINTDCPRDRACFSQKCRDPCIGACGVNTICQTINHKPVCSCPSGFIGNPRVQCSAVTKGLSQRC